MQEVEKELDKYENAVIEVERVVDPNVNHHNIYALLELTKRSSDIFKARFFVTFIS